MVLKKLLKISLISFASFIGIIVLIVVIIGIVRPSTPSEPPTEPSAELPSPSLTPEQELELAYTQSVVKINGDVSEAMEYFGVLFQEKPSILLWTEQEIIKVAMYTVIIEESYKSAKELNPPEKYKSVQSLFLSGLSKYAEAMPILIYGIDHSDADKINQASELLLEGNVFINQTTEEMNKLK